MKRKISLAFLGIFFLICILVIGRIKGTEYVLEEVTTDEWVLERGNIKLDGLNRQFKIGDLVYVGPNEKDVKKITLELKTKSIFGIFPDETLSLSSIGESESWKIKKGFTYGSVSGSTHSTNVLKSYFLKTLELHVLTESSTGVDGVVVDIPLH